MIAPEHDNDLLICVRQKRKIEGGFIRKPHLCVWYIAGLRPGVPFTFNCDQIIISDDVEFMIFGRVSDGDFFSSEKETL